MIYECKVFDRDGRLKKILRGSDLVPENNKGFLEKEPKISLKEYKHKLSQYRELYPWL